MINYQKTKKKFFYLIFLKQINDKKFNNKKKHKLLIYKYLKLKSKIKKLLIKKIRIINNKKIWIKKKD